MIWILVWSLVALATLAWFFGRSTEDNSVARQIEEGERPAPYKYEPKTLDTNWDLELEALVKEDTRHG